MRDPLKKSALNIVQALLRQQEVKCDANGKGVEEDLSVSLIAALTGEACSIIKLGLEESQWWSEKRTLERVVGADLELDLEVLTRLLEANKVRREIQAGE